MAISLSNFLICCGYFLTIIKLAESATVNYDFNITWVRANPDGLFERPTIGINGKWPIPRIEATIGDRIIVNVYNQLGNQSTSLHFHGLFQNGTTSMDGPVGVSQCAIPPGASFKYNFTIDQPGTYWYHSHNFGQYPDGLRGPLIIHDPESPHKEKYDEELVLTLSDWYHDEMPGLIKHFISYANPTGAEPVPNSALMNETQNLTIAVEPGKTYFIRVINMAAFAAQYLWFEGHTVRIVEVDGVWTEEAEADMLYITAAQRYGLLLTAKNETSKNFAIVGSMDQDLFDTVPPGLNPNVTSYLVYDKKAPLPTPAFVDKFDPFDDFTLVPSDGLELYDHVDYSFNLDVQMDNLGDGANYAFFNGITFVRPKVPVLYSALTTGPNATDPAIYGVNTHAFVLKKNEIIEIVLNNHDPGKHPFHLHGHNFQTVFRSEEEAGDYMHNETLPKVPMRRDVFMVRPNGNMVLRFKADNPGIWLFHCHIEWHVDSGLVATMVEAPEELQKTLTIPEDHYQVCRDQGEPIAGNGAGNTKNYLDLTGNNLPPAPLPAGFQAKGIVALVFSCIAAFLGLGVISWYGFGELGQAEIQHMNKRIAEAHLDEQK